MSKIISFVGMPGSGASTAAKYISQKGFPRVYFGGVIYDAMREAGIEITAESQAAFRRQIRDQSGDDFVVKKIIQQINDLKQSGQHLIVADSIYSWTEYKTLKHAFPGEITVVAILASRSIRHKRLAKRPERPFTPEQAKKRDWDEIEQIEKGGPIAVADHYIINQSTIDNLQANVDDILKEIDFVD